MKNLYENYTEQEWETYFRVFLENKTLEHIKFASLSDTFSKTVEALSSPESALEKFKQERGAWEEYSFHNSGWGPGPSGRIIMHAMREMESAIGSLNKSREMGSLSHDPNTRLPHIFLNTLSEFKEYLGQVEGQGLDSEALLAPYIVSMQESCEKFTSLDMKQEAKREASVKYSPKDIKIYLRQKLFREPSGAWEMVQSGAAPFLDKKFKGQQELLFSLKRLEKESSEAFEDHFSYKPGKTPREHREFLDETLDAQMKNPVVKAAYDEIVASDDYKQAQVEYAKLDFMKELDRFQSDIEPLISKEQEFIGAINMSKILRMSAEAKGMPSEKIESLQSLSSKLQDCIDITDQRKFYFNMRGGNNPHSAFFKDKNLSENLASNLYLLFERHTELSREDLDNSGIFEKISRDFNSNFEIR